MPRENIGPPEIDGKVGPDSPFYGVIEGAYRVFDCPKPMQTGVCGWEMYPEIERDFFNTDIRDLPLKYVRDWFFATCNPDLPRSVWGYLLPRVLEILAVGEEVNSIALEISLNRFPTGDRGKWSEEEWAVLDAFQRQYLTQSMCQPYPAPELDDALCMFGIAKWPLEGLFAQVLEFEDEVLVSKLWRDWCAFGVGYITPTTFWGKKYESKVLAFYTARPLYDRMVAYGMNEDTPKELSGRALDIADTIRMYASWRET